MNMGKMPLQWMHDAVKLQEERQGKFDRLSSRMMKDYVNNQIGKIKRSRMWAPPLRSVLGFALKKNHLFPSTVTHFFTFIHMNPCLIFIHIMHVYLCPSNNIRPFQFLDALASLDFTLVRKSVGAVSNLK